MVMVARKLSTTSAMANVHVAFSRKSAVRRTPIIWFDPAKFDANPPPLGFWAKTISISKIDTITTNVIINVNIAYGNL